MRFQPGDVLAFMGHGVTSRLIEWLTWGPSHVGIVCSSSMGPVLVESTSLCKRPCLVAGMPVVGVQVHRPCERIEDYGGRCKVYRLAPMWKLTSAESDRLTASLMGFVEARDRYDYGRALLSATKVIKWLNYPDEGSQFCSELCAGVLMRIGRLPVSNPAGYNPGSLCRELRRTGVAGPVELN